MSTLRTDTLQTTDSSKTVSVADIASASSLSSSVGATQVGYGATTVAAALDGLSGTDYVLRGSGGVIDDTAKLQAAVDAWSANRNLQIKVVGKVNVVGTVTVANNESDDPETRLKFVGGGTLYKGNAGFMFDRPVGQVFQTGHIFFEGVRFEGAALVGQTFIINGDNIIRTHFIGCFIDKINIAKASNYLQTIYLTAGTTCRKWKGYLFDCGYLFDVAVIGSVCEQGDAVLITRTGTSDPACNSLKIIGSNIEGNTGVSGAAIKVGVCFGSTIKDNYYEQNAGGDLDCNQGTGFHKGLTISGNGFQPTTAQLANPNYYPIITGKGATGSIVIQGNGSTGNLCDVTIGNQSAILQSGNWCAAGKVKFSPTSPRVWNADDLNLTVSLASNFGVNLDSYGSSVGFENTRGLVNSVSTTSVVMYGTVSPQTSPGSFVQTQWQVGSVVINSAPVIAVRQYGVGNTHNALIYGWQCITAGAPGVWQEISILLPY